MIRRLLWQRAFKCGPLILAIALFLLFIGSASYAIYSKGIPIQDKHLWRFFPLLAFGFAILAGGVAEILKADICRSSTSMIPHFRRKMLNFFLSFGVILGSVALLFLLNPLWNPSWLRHLSLVLPLSLFLFGISLFLFHIWPSWIIFLVFLAMIGNYPLQFGFLEPLPVPLLLISLFIIWGYRTMMLKINEDHRFYGTLASGLGTSLRETAKRQATSADLIGVRWQFEHILKLCRYQRQLGRMFLPLLIVLRSNVVHLLNPLDLTLSLILFSSLSTATLGTLLAIPVGIIVLNMKLSGERPLPLETVKPLSRKKLFLSEYLSYYFPLLAFLLLFRLSGLLRPYNPLYHWLESGMKDIPHIYEPVLIAAPFFLISFLVLSIRRASWRNSCLLFFIGIVLTTILFLLSQIIGLLPILAIFSILTVLFLIIAFRLDCRRDI